MTGLFSIFKCEDIVQLLCLIVFVLSIYLCNNLMASIMKNLNKFGVLAIFIALFFVQPMFGDNIPNEGTWGDEYYRSIVKPQPPKASIEGDILSLVFETDLNDLTVCVLDNNGVRVYEDVVSSEAGGTYSFSLAGQARGQYQLVMLHRLGHLTGNFALK